MIATQNSLDQVGTSPCRWPAGPFPDAAEPGFPDRASERALLALGLIQLFDNSMQRLAPEALQQLQQRCFANCSELIDYVLDLVEVSRQRHPGLSPRASQGLLAAARAWSLLDGRDHVVIDDVQAVLPAVVSIAWMRLSAVMAHRTVKSVWGRPGLALN